MSSYERLLARFREISLLTSAAATLSWDEETGLPPAGVPFRADQLAWLSGQAHRLAIAPEVGDWLAQAEADLLPGLPPGSPEATNLRGLRRDYDRDARLPTEFVEDFARHTSHAHAAWIQARRDSHFPTFAPFLEKFLDLHRRRADFLGHSGNPYDALLDLYEPGATAASLTTLFDTLLPELRDILHQALDLAAALPRGLLDAYYPVPGQNAFSREIAAAFGFDFTRGRIDTAVHPFCTTLGPHDCRLTTRHDEWDFTVCLYSILHETGHGLYEQGLPPAHFGLPAAQAVSLGIHESQSRLWENKIARSPEFWRHWRDTFVRQFFHVAHLSADQITAAVNRPALSHIRVEADEMTYDLHIILRFRLEQRLLSGELPVHELPAAWNHEFQQLVGLPVPDDARGCLQDTHWSVGLFGYFPTYTLGNLHSAQLHAAAHQQIPNLADSLARADYAPLLHWLRENIHQHGRAHLPADLIARATGSLPDPRHQLDYLRGKLKILAGA